MIPIGRRSALRMLWAAAVHAVHKEWSILPLGDSITAGGTSFHSYRGPLAKMVRQAGLPVRWVGSQSTPADEPLLPHDGYPGKPIQYLAANMQQIYSANPADIILLHAGHNHTVEEKPIPGILASTREIIQIARRINPQAIILLAQVIPSGKLPKYAYIPALNVQLAALAKDINTKASPVVLVDQATGFDVQADTIADHVHPNQRGAEKMARAWFDALRPILQP